MCSHSHIVIEALVVFALVVFPTRRDIDLISHLHNLVGRTPYTLIKHLKMYTSQFSSERLSADDHELQDAFSAVTLSPDKNACTPDTPTQQPKFWRSGSDSVATLSSPSFLPLGPIHTPAEMHSPPANRQPGQTFLPRPVRTQDDQSRSQHSHTYGIRGQMNIHAPIYVPQYAQNDKTKTQHSLLDPGPKAPDQAYDTNLDYFTSSSISSGSGYSGMTNVQTRDGTSANTSATTGSGLQGGYQPTRLGPPLKTAANEDETQKLRVELILKNQIIKNLTDQLSSLNRAQPRIQNESSWSGAEPQSQTLQVPSNHYQLFIDLSQTLQNTNEELEDTKARLEAFVVAAALNPGNSSTVNGRYDEQEMTHRIVGKMAMLQQENERLLTMMSYGNRTSLLVEVGVLRQAIKALQEANAEKEQTKDC